MLMDFHHEYTCSRHVLIPIAALEQFGLFDKDKLPFTDTCDPETDAIVDKQRTKPRKN